MKKKIILLGLCVLLAVSMIGASVISSCGTKSTTTTTTHNNDDTGKYPATRRVINLVHAMGFGRTIGF